MDRRVEKLKALKERAQLAGRVDPGCSAEPDPSVEAEDRQCVFAGQFVGGEVWAGKALTFAGALAGTESRILSPERN